MRFSRRIVFKIAAYFFYALVLTTVLLIVRFPHEKLRVYLISFAENKLPETQCEIKSIGYQFPIGLKVHDLQVKSAGDAKQILKIDSIIVQPELINPIGRFTLRVNAYEQEHVVHLNVDWWGKRVSIRDFKINKLDLSQFNYIHERFGREFSGFLNISGTYKDSSGDGGERAGDGKITIADCSVRLLLPILSQEVFDFKKIETDFTVNNETIEFVNGRFNGNKIKGDFGGQVQLFQQLISSRLNIKGKLIPQAGVLKNNPQAAARVNQLKRQFRNSAFPFFLEGNLRTPAFGFGN